MIYLYREITLVIDDIILIDEIYSKISIKSKDQD